MTSTNPTTAPDKTSQPPQTLSRCPQLFSFPPLSSNGDLIAFSPPIGGVEANPSHVSPSDASPQLPALPSLAEELGIQRGLSTEELALACHWADDGMTFVVQNTTRKLDDLLRGHKDRTHVINTTYHENVENEGVKLETAMQGLLIQFLQNVKTQIGGHLTNAASTSDDTDAPKPAGAVDMAQIEQMFEGMKISVLKELGKHQESMKKLKSNDTTKLTKLGEKSTAELVAIQHEAETNLKHEIAIYFIKGPRVPQQATSHPAAEKQDLYAVQSLPVNRIEADTKSMKRISNTNKSRAGKGLNDTTNMPIQQQTHLQKALRLRPLGMPHHVTSLPARPTRPARGIFARRATANRTTDMFTRPDPVATPLPYTEDLIQIKQEDFYIDTAETMKRVKARNRVNESPTKKRRVD